MSERLREMCKSLRLAYVADIYNQIPYESPDQFLEAVFKEEFRLREEAKVQRLIKKAKFLDTNTLANYEWHEQIRFLGHIDKDGLQSLSFLEHGENVVRHGSADQGNGELSSGLGRTVCEHVYEVRFFRVAELVERLETALRQDKLAAFRKRFEKVDLIVLDEMGYLPFGKEGSELLFQLISEWYEQKSLIITSN